MTSTDISIKLSKRIYKLDILELLDWTRQHSENLHAFYNYILSSDHKVASNALWVLTWDKYNRHTFLKNDLISLALTTENATIRRLSLTLLSRMQWPVDEIRADLFDFCMNHFLNDTEAPGVRAICIKVTFLLSRPYPELANELKMALNFISNASIPPAVLSAKNQILRRI